MSVQSCSLEIGCPDGYALGATLFHSPPPARKLALIGPALGVPARFYHDYAAFLAGHGLTTLTWDWRGLGLSRPPTLKGFKASARDWATKDLPAVIDWARNRYPLPIVGIGHSFGAQAYGLAARADAFDRLLLIAAPTGYWGMAPAPGRYVFRLLLAVFPLITRIYGYMPAKMLGIGEDLPRDAALEWFRWCRTPEYLGTWSGHAEIEVPVRALGFRDDTWAPDASRRWLLEKYGGNAKELKTIDPAGRGLPVIGHHGYFRRRRAEALWPDELGWLLA